MAGQIVDSAFKPRCHTSRGSGGWAGIFVGLWAPTFLNLGMYLKQLHPSREG